MKKLRNGLIGASLLSLLLIIGAAPKAKAQDVSVSYQSFYDNLSPYGQWVNDPQYGNVWVPNESGDFRPYGSRGHWVMTDYGNTWVSDDPWGWACYHYGRWSYDSYYGWLWVPGYEWAPAWVSWRYGGGYSGWAPLGPGVNVGVSYNCPSSWWVFVEPQYMYGNDCYSHWRGPSYNEGYIRECPYVNNYYKDNHTNVRYNYGPRADVIERDTHRPVQVYKVAQGGRPGESSMSGNRITMYRPAVDRNSANNARPANVIQAPRAIGRPQAATNVAGNKPAPFRQAVQNNTLPRGGQPNAAAQGGNRPAPAQNNNRQPAVNSQPQHNNRFSAPQSQPAQHQQPAPQQHQQPAPQQHQQPAPQQHQQPMPQQHQQPMPQQHQQPAPQRQQQPMPQQHQQPEPQRQQQPMPQQHQQPMPQQQRQQPMPQQHQAPAPRQEAPHEEPREGGGGRR